MTHNPFSLEGKTILVTGASSGIGRAIAIECSKMGARVVLNGRSEERLAETLAAMDPREHIVIAADLVSDEAIAGMVAEIPVVDGAVLCAGVAVTLPVQFSDRKNMDKIFNVNFFSTAELMRMLYKKKKIAKGGSLVLLDSIGGVTTFTYGSAIYGATKGALNSFAKTCAREFAARKIRVNCLCPGMIETPLIGDFILTEEERRADENLYPLGRYGQPEEVAYSAVYLLSDASVWVTGTNMIIDGGLSIV